eukprot:COSAG01_NODE_2_length_63927_cov_1357.611941_37_plen_116_part_00
MTRVKRGSVARKRRKKILKRCSGFRASLSKLFRPANQAYIHALSYKYRDRRNKKRMFRRLWISRINASLSELNLKYSRCIALLKTKKIILNRKMLSELAIQEEKAFITLIEHIKT